MTLRIATSILAADFAALASEVQRVSDGGADLIHVDVMDGHFVPNLTMGIPVVEALKRSTALPLDVHLMIERPERHLASFIRAGASIVSIHAEACARLDEPVAAIRDLGALPGVAINPETPLSAVQDVLPHLHHLLVMSVVPGFTGQTFIPAVLAKIAEARTLIDASGADVAIEVDGGVGIRNAAEIVRAGADILVAGAAIFHSADPAQAVRDLRAAALAP